MKLNAHKIALIEAQENGTIETVAREKAIECFRLAGVKQMGYRNDWSEEQFYNAFIEEAAELVAEKAAEQAPKANSNYTSRRSEITVKNGFAGTARDHARGFDGIE